RYRRPRRGAFRRSRSWSRRSRRSPRWSSCPRSSSTSSRRSEEHTSELQSRFDLVCRLLLEKKKLNSDSLFQNQSLCLLLFLFVFRLLLLPRFGPLPLLFLFLIPLLLALLFFLHASLLVPFL